MATYASQPNQKKTEVLSQLSACGSEIEAFHPHEVSFLVNNDTIRLEARMLRLEVVQN